MKKLTIPSCAEEKIKKGQFAIEKQDFPSLPFHHQAVELINTKGQFVGIAYLSEQNKGIGWFISHKKITFDIPFFCQLFQHAKKKRQVYQQSEETTAYRLFNQEGDGFGGFTIDLYQDYAVFSWYNLFVYEMKETIVQAFQHVFSEVAGAYEKIRFKGLNVESAHVYGQEAPTFFAILENGVRYQVFLNDGLMTGIFLDQHEVRGSLVGGLAAGKSLIVLDPPSFARNKKQTFSVAKDYHKLIAQSLEILNPHGMIIASTNAANISRSKFKKEIEKGFAGSKHRYLKEYGLPADFTYNKKDERSNYLKVFTIKVDK